MPYCNILLLAQQHPAAVLLSDMHQLLTQTESVAALLQEYLPACHLAEVLTFRPAELLKNARRLRHNFEHHLGSPHISSDHLHALKYQTVLYM